MYFVENGTFQKDSLDVLGIDRSQQDCSERMIGAIGAQGGYALYDRTMAQFAAAIDGKGQPSATGVDGVKSLAVAEAVKQAAVSGQATKVDYCGV